MVITAQDVNKLRQITGAGMMDCKKALSEANGDFEAAIDILRKRGQKISAKRADREATEGCVFVETFTNDTEGVLVALSCETDFVARNEEFQALGKNILAVATQNKPTSKEDLLNLTIDNLAIHEHITTMVGKIGEKIEIAEYIYIKGEKIVTYIHSGSKLGVLVSLENTGSADYVAAGKDVGMQIAAMNPIALDEKSVDATTIERELEIAKERARAEGKPENIIEKIAQGSLQKFYKESTLLLQPFVKDGKMSVQDYLTSVNKGMTVREFRRISLGAN